MAELSIQGSPTGNTEISKPRPIRPTSDVSSEEKAAVRERIITAARRVFFRDGFANANINDVADGAGVGKGTVYRHFDGKAELFVATIVENGPKMVEYVSAVASSDGTALDRIERLLRFYLDFWVDHPVHFQLFWAVQSQDVIGELSSELIDRVRIVCERPLRVVEELIRDGIVRGEIRECDPWSTAHALTAIGNATVAPILDPRVAAIAPRDPHAVFAEAVSLAIHGLRPGLPDTA